MRVVAITKGFPASVVEAALEAGLDAVGESYAQELVAKAGELAAAGASPEWHFVGRLQRNKVRAIADVVTLWQSVDRIELAREIAKRRPGARVLVQLNLSGEPQKGGCAPERAEDLVVEVAALGLEVRGLMGVGPSGPPERSRPGFRALVGLADRLGLEERSIGMSGDLEVAVEEGATMVRVGRDLFGDRPVRPTATSV